jgi:hypothetical protein
VSENSAVPCASTSYRDNAELEASGSRLGWSEKRTCRSVCSVRSAGDPPIENWFWSKVAGMTEITWQLCATWPRAECSSPFVARRDQTTPVGYLALAGLGYRIDDAEIDWPVIRVKSLVQIIDPASERSSVRFSILTVLFDSLTKFVARCPGGAEEERLVLDNRSAE